MKKLFILSLIMLGFGCQEESKSWQLTESIKLEGINPIGLTTTSEGIWLSDGDHNRVVLIDDEGRIKKSIDSLERPMHISSHLNEILIPQYGKDNILGWNENVISALELTDSLDAPAGVWKEGDAIAIADFYNNRILYANDGKNWISFGEEGKAEGQFYYPTDVQITEDAIWVADAYNNRIQKFNKNGEFQLIVGEDQKMNAATGIYVSDDNIFVTDFENDRVLVFDKNGVLLQELSANIHKPTDVILNDGKLYVTNYRNSILNVFEWKVNEKHDEEEEHHHDH